MLVISFAYHYPVKLFHCQHCPAFALHVPAPPLRFVANQCEAFALLCFALPCLRFSHFAEQIKAVAILIISAHSLCTSFLTTQSFALLFPCYSVLCFAFAELIHALPRLCLAFQIVAVLCLCFCLAFPDNAVPLPVFATPCRCVSHHFNSSQCHSVP